MSYVGKADAEDVAQAALTALVQHAEKVEARAVAAWLRTAVLLKAREHTASRRELILAKLPEPATDETPEVTLRSREIGAAVRAALARVPASRREIVREVLGEDKPVAAVARDEGIPESTVRARLRDGTEDLRGELVRGRAAEQRRTGGSTSWLLVLSLKDMRGVAAKVAALGAAVAGGALLALAVTAPKLGPTAEDLPPRAVDVAPLPWAVNEARGEPGVERADAVVLRERSRHDAGAHFRAERFGR